MMNTGDTTVHFTKMKPMELAEIRSVLEKRPKEKFSLGLSPEAREAMMQVSEETKIQQAARRGKRGSKGNVLFNETVQIRQEVAAGPNMGRRASVSDIFDHSQIDSTYKSHMGALSSTNGELTEDGATPRRTQGRRRSSVTKWVIERQSTLSGSGVDEVEQVQSANRLADDSADVTSP
ncbi:uncharacterized protein LOC131937631 [Physella acuta]|uniref:uncharacterized protein LOC131937631 n=1 Tax=Physella acuta TaxID=109671 RepID=UPI0027DBBAE4|nr:uncharacterized protein LOC131937631 [Physella acuta]